jgi:hypothetical protein
MWMVFTMKWILELALQLMAALVVGLVFALICGVMGSEILTLLNVQTISRDLETVAIFGGNVEAWERAMRGFLSAILGFAVGNPVGVYLMGKRRRIGGSFWLSFAWCVSTGVATVYLMQRPGEDPWGLLGVFLFFLTPVFAVLGFNLPMIWKGSGPGQGG